MAAQFAEMWEALGRPENFAIVEQGAHGGEFARDVLEAASAHHPEFFATIRYEIVEPFPALKERQLAALATFDSRVTWRDSLDDLPAYRGVHFSNELVDAMPVHLVRWTGEKWMERHVTERNGEFAFVDGSLSDHRIAERLRRIPAPLPVHYETEVNLGTAEWIEALSAKLIEGFVLAVDYGWPRDEFYASERTTGTLRCYAKHRVVASPLEQVGHADITAHVEWTSVAEHGEQSGLTVVGFTDQHHFITGLLAGPLREEFESAVLPARARQLQTLLQPSHLGMNFQYLVFAKGAAARTASLSGLRFARDPREALQLDDADVAPRPPTLSS
jgi:SAM-dependent MidA family methyltransferase